MGVFDRISNIWKGFISLWISEVEQSNPEAVYEAAIDERVKKHRELKKAVSGIVYLRNKLQSELEQKTKALKELEFQIPVAIEEGEDEAALLLIEKKDEVEARLQELTGELEKVSAVVPAICVSTVVLFGLSVSTTSPDRSRRPG